MPMMEMFDRGIQMRMGQAHVHRWTDDILPLVLDPADPLGTLDLTTHQLPLADAPRGVRDVPEQGGRLHQGRSQAVTRRVVLVIGGSSGIGLAAARAFATRGDAVILAARSAEGLAAAERALA